MAIALFLICSTGCYLGLRAWFAPRLGMQRRLENVSEWGSPERGHTATQTDRPSIVRRLARATGHLLGRRGGVSGWSRIQRKLAQAGSPFGMTSREWVGVRTLLLVAAALSASVTVAAGSGRGAAWFLAVCLVGFAWIAPDFWLSHRVQERQRQVMRDLPNALDLLTVSVEAGLGFDQALDRLAQHVNGPLAEEFARCLREMQMGSARAAALQRLADRMGVDAIRHFIAAVVQSETLGVGIAQVLRVQAAEVRRRRRMDAQERAMKAPVQMLFPLILFVFPALFIVVLGPAMLQMLQVFHG
ncbi:MAG: type II secretion system F family protein [Alicyclobacillus sp.]|nr:type II secretion system F family protein [Alicyclobacillus sp.]